jgi:four helix bundle protein
LFDERLQILRSFRSKSTPARCVASADFVQAIVGCPLKPDELSVRARRFAVRTLKFVRTLPRDPAADAVARQLARSATSVSANHRSARRARSRAEFIARLALVLDESDESEHWFVVLIEAEIGSGPELEWLLDESRHLMAIFQRSVATARSNAQSAARAK